MSHACHRFWKCYKTLTFCSLLRRCTIPCACHAKRHLNIQKWSETLVFLTFWLWNVLRATTLCTFSTSQLLKVVRDPGVLYILTSKCASRHNGVQLFISHLARWLRTRHFSEPTFRPSGATNHWKNTVFRDFPTFSRICIFFLLALSLLWSSLFYSSLLSDSSHLCFSSVHIVGSLTSKLPSRIRSYLIWLEAVKTDQTHPPRHATILCRDHLLYLVRKQPLPKIVVSWDHQMDPNGMKVKRLWQILKSPAS